MSRGINISLQGETDIVLEGYFNAKPGKLFDLLTDPSSIPAFWGYEDHATVVEKMDVRAGGAWRFRHTSPDGIPLVFYGDYFEVEPGQRLVQSFTYEPRPDEVALERITFEPLGEGTLMRIVQAHSSRLRRDAVSRGGHGAGASSTFRRLEQLALSGAVAGMTEQEA